MSRLPTPQQMAGAINALTNAVNAIFKQILSMRRELSAADAARRLADAGRKPLYPIEFTSQFGEDWMAWEILGRPIDGYFIEVGAFDGYSYSVTYALECMGWKGLLVEAIPERFEACKARRKNSKVVHSALGPPGQPPSVEFNIVHDQYGGMLSFADGAAAATKNITTQGAKVTKVKVPTATLDSLLADHTGPIHLAVIDVESLEVPVLRGLDLMKRGPLVLLVEEYENTPTTDLDAFFASMPYVRCGSIENSRILVRADQTEIQDRAKKLMSQFR